MFWAFNQGKAGKERLYEEAEKAADIGTVAHAMVEADLAGKPMSEVMACLSDLPNEESREKAHGAYQAYVSWQEQSKLEILDQEMQLISEEFKYGGTPDAIGQIGNELCLVDWKTSNSVYPDYLIQLAAYKHLWEENNPDSPLTGGFHLCRFAKEHGDFAHHFYPNLDEAWRMFVLLREAYEIDKQLKKRTK